MKTSTGHPASSAAFDWTMGCFSVLIMIGVFQDGWAHNHGRVDQSFFTPWHAILYSTMAVTGIALAITGVRNLRRGYSFRSGLPYGYWTSATGVVLFLAGGAFDMWWHTLFGIEVRIEGLISPSHLLLALGGALVFAGTLRSIAWQYGPDTGGWKRIGPAVLASLAMLMLLGFFTQYASPFSDNTMEAVLGKPAPAGAELYSVHIGRKAQTRLVSLANAAVFGVAVSPDARRMAYSQQSASGADDAPSAVVVANADGSGARTITSATRRNIQAAWSPDGRRIAYISMPAQTSGEFQLHVIAAGGSQDRIVAHGVTRMLSPSWSPDNAHIVVASRNGVNDQLESVDATTGSQRWIDGTQGATGAAVRADGNIAFEDANANVSLWNRLTHRAKTIAVNGARPRFSANGQLLVFLRDVGFDTQAFVAGGDGTHQRNVSMLHGLNATTTSVANDGTVFFTAAGHLPAPVTEIGKAYGIDQAIVSSIILVGIVLIVVRRWRAPIGAMTVLIGLYTVALATQGDMYYTIPAALIVALAADIYLAVLKDRARDGVPLYAFAFALPALLFALYEVTMNAKLGGLGWSSNLLLGTPLIAGICGLLISYCWRTPLLPPAQTPARSEDVPGFNAERPRVRATSK